MILHWWGEMGLLEKRFRDYADDPDITHVICEAETDLDGNRKAVVFMNSILAGQWRGRWNHVLVRAHEMTGDTREEREECLRGYLRQGVNGNPDSVIRFGDIRE